MKKQKQTPIVTLENSYHPMCKCPKSWGQLPKQEAPGTLPARAPPLRVWGGGITKGLSLPQAEFHGGVQCNLDIVPVLSFLLPRSRKDRWT